MASSMRMDKQVFFRRLDELDELAFETDSEATSEYALKIRPLYHHHDTLHCEHTSPEQEILNSEVRPTPSTITGLGPTAPLSDVITMPAQASKRRTVSGKLPPKPSRKKRSKKSIQLQREDAQIFRGLVFYFLPNNDIAVPRRKRIEKAQEYGALWAREWSADVTHIIVDANLRMSVVEKVIGSDQLKPRHIIVNEKYPPDCIEYQVLLPTHLLKFQVAHDGSQHGPAGERQQLLEKSPKLASGPINRCTVPEAADAAAKTDNEHGEPAVVTYEPASFATVKVFRISVATTNERGEESDELDKLVAEVQGTADLPLDLEDDSFEPSFSTSSSDSEDDQQTRTQEKNQKRSASDVADAQLGFSCMRKNEGTSKSKNPNLRTIEMLDKMAQYYDRIDDRWRTMSYRKAITALKRQMDHITTREQAIEIPGIGERLASKIEEIASTNRLRRLESTIVDPNDQLLQLFMGIYQVGLPTASRWIAQGHQSLEDLKTKADLTPNQRIGLDHYDDFMSRIPRIEVMAHADIVRKACAKADAQIQLVVGGSYRRGSADCGDIDLIITKESASLEQIRTTLVDTVIPQLFEDGFLQVGLATSSSRSRVQGSKWHGASALPGSQVWRRIDLLFVPWDEFGAALIYFTGNDIFNRSIRLLASRKKMRLNQHGLYADVMRGEKRERITQGKLLEGRSEERIFEILGVPWRPPEHRIC